MARVPKVARERILRGMLHTLDIKQICDNFSSDVKSLKSQFAIQHDFVLKIFYTLFTRNRFEMSEYIFLMT